MTTKWIRTCQECGNTQEDKQPIMNPTDAYCDRICKKCKSESLDYGSYQNTPEFPINTIVTVVVDYDDSTKNHTITSTLAETLYDEGKLAYDDINDVYCTIGNCTMADLSREEL